MRKAYFVKLLPEQVANAWELIKTAAEESLPPTSGAHPDRTNRLLSMCLSGKVTVWFSYSKDEEDKKFEGLVLTNVIYDEPSGTKQLLIYVLWGNLISKDAWKLGIDGLIKYAKSIGCSEIIAYTQKKFVVKVAESLGADTSWHLLRFDVNKSVKKSNGLLEV